MELAKTREFILGAYHDLPNVLMVGSLLFGSIAGYRPLLWIALGLVGNLPITYLLQYLVKQLATNVPSIASYLKVQHRGRCAMFTDTTTIGSNQGSQSSQGIPSIIDSYVPSWWITSAFFFVGFTCWNGISVLFGENKNATQDQKNNRRAYALSVILISCVIAFMACSRVFDGCETAFGTALGASVGIIWAIVYWQVLDVCHSGITPDVLQIIQNSAPSSTGVVTPIVCA